MFQVKACVLSADCKYVAATGVFPAETNSARLHPTTVTATNFYAQTPKLESNLK
jgi:hypothetical protein